MLPLVRLIALLGRRFPLPGTRFFLGLIALSLLLFASFFVIVSWLDGMGADAPISRPTEQVLMQGLLVLSGLLFVASGAPLLYRLAFVKGGGAVVRSAADRQVAVGSVAEAVSRRDFADGCTILLFSFVGIAFLMWIDKGLL